MLTRRIEIRGRVQGVGFRYAMRSEAARLGVRGWVRNRRDGSVEALAHGEPVAVERLIEWARSGPPAARVVEVRTAPADGGDFPEFELRPTL